MTDIDEWINDPSVQIMRNVFKGIEAAQDELLERLNISPYDLRIRSWREKALIIFEEAWGIAMGMGINMGEKTSSSVYLHCLAKVIDPDRSKIPEGMLPEGQEIEILLREIFK